jgi:hypothetical protein
MRHRPWTAVCAALALATAGATEAATVAVHGTVSQGYLRSSGYNYLTPDTRQGTFAFNEGIINFSGQIDGRTRVGLQFLGRDFGPVGNGEVIVDWAFGDYRWRDSLGFRVGKVKVPLGLYNKTRDVDAVRTSILLPQSVYTETFRSIATAIQGFGVYGNLPLGSGSVDYEACAGTIEMGSSRFLSDVLSGLVGAAPMLSYTVEDRIGSSVQVIWNTPAEGLRVGGTWSSLDVATVGTFALGAPTPWAINIDAKARSAVVLSADYMRGPAVLAAEYTRYEVDVDLTNIPFPDGMGGLIPVSSGRTDRRGGYYGQGSYRVDPRLELGAYYSVFHPDWRDRDGVDSGLGHRAWQKDLALTVRVDLTANWILKLEGHFLDGTGDVLPELNPGGMDARTWRMFAAKSTFNF